MKLINIFMFLLSLLVIVSCKSNSSYESSVGILLGGGKSMLLTKASALTGEEVICKFNCDLTKYEGKISVLEKAKVRSKVCSNPKYVEIIYLGKNSYIKSWFDKNFLGIEGKVIQVNLGREELNNITKMFNKNDELLGAPKTVCNSSITGEYNGGLILDLVQQEISNSSSWEGVSSWNEVQRQIKNIDRYEKYDSSLVTKSEDENFYVDKKNNKRWILLLDKRRTYDEGVSACSEQEGVYYLPTYTELYTFLKHGGDKFLNIENGDILTRSWAKIQIYGDSYRGDILIYRDNVNTHKFNVINKNDEYFYDGYVTCVGKIVNNK